MIKINLVPQEILDKEAGRQRAAQGAAVGLAVLLFVVAISAAHYWSSISLDKTLKTDAAELNRLKIIVDQVTELENQTRQVHARLDIVQSLMKYRGLYPRFMEDLAKTLPPGVWLASLTTSGDQKGLTITLGCKGAASDDAAALLKAFDGSERFKEPLLNGTITVGGGTAQESAFSITVKYIPTPG
jgi:Tfp pilus assembly protein PilN